VFIYWDSLPLVIWLLFGLLYVVFWNLRFINANILELTDIFILVIYMSLHSVVST